MGIIRVIFLKYNVDLFRGSIFAKADMAFFCTFLKDDEAARNDKLLSRSILWWLI